MTALKKNRSDGTDVDTVVRNFWANLWRVGDAADNSCHISKGFLDSSHTGLLGFNETSSSCDVVTVFWISTRWWDSLNCLTAFEHAKDL